MTTEMDRIFDPIPPHVILTFHKAEGCTIEAYVEGEEMPVTLQVYYVCYADTNTHTHICSYESNYWLVHCGAYAHLDHYTLDYEREEESGWSDFDTRVRDALYQWQGGGQGPDAWFGLDDYFLAAYVDTWLKVESTQVSFVYQTPDHFAIDVDYLFDWERYKDYEWTFEESVMDVLHVDFPEIC